MIGIEAPNHTSGSDSENLNRSLVESISYWIRPLIKPDSVSANWPFTKSRFYFNLPELSLYGV